MEKKGAGRLVFSENVNNVLKEKSLFKSKFESNPEFKKRVVSYLSENDESGLDLTEAENAYISWGFRKND